jgi:glycosyltransferase involved in cell wall biosynthesis
MRILHVIPFYRPALAFGGPVSVCAKLAEAMVRRGHDVQVLTTDAASRSARLGRLEEVIDGVHVVRVRNLSQRAVATNLYTPYPARSMLAPLLQSADVVHVHEFFNWLSFRAATEAEKRRRPVLLSGHGSLSLADERGRVGVKRAWLNLLGGRTIRAARAVQAAWDYEAEQCVLAGVPRDKLRIISQGVAPPPRAGDGARFRAQHGLDGERPIVLFVGRLRASKGVDLLLAVAERLAVHPARPLFVFAGAAENRPDLGPTPPGSCSLADPRASTNESNVLRTGALTESELDDAYGAASLFALPSFAEGIPMAALDALAHGVPVVLSHACNLADIEQAGAGLLVNCDVESLHKAIETLLNQPERLREMAAQGQRLARERYSSEQVHARYEALYAELARA